MAAISHSRQWSHSIMEWEWIQTVTGTDCRREIGLKTASTIWSPTEEWGSWSTKDSCVDNKCTFNVMTRHRSVGLLSLILLLVFVPTKIRDTQQQIYSISMADTDTDMYIFHVLFLLRVDLLLP